MTAASTISILDRFVPLTELEKKNLFQPKSVSSCSVSIKQKKEYRLRLTLTLS